MITPLHKYNAQIERTNRVANRWTPLHLEPSIHDDDVLLPHHHTATSEPVYEITIAHSDLDRLERNLDEYRQLREWLSKNPQLFKQYDMWVTWNALKQ